MTTLAMLGIHSAATGSVPAGTLVSDGILRAPAVFARAQTSSRSTAIGADDSTLGIFAADIPRFAGSARRLLLEGSRTNNINAPLVFNTGWTALTGGTGTAAIITPGYGSIAAPDGSFTATRLQLNKGAGTTSTDQSGLTIATVTSAARFVWVRTLTGTANVQIGTNATTAGVQSNVDTTWRRLGATGTGGVHRINLNGAALNSASADLLVWGASVESSATFASSLVLPPVGVTATSTRGADLVTASLAALGVAGSGACTVLLSGRMPQLWTGALQTLFQLDDGTTTARWFFDTPTAGTTLRTNGTGVTTISTGSLTAGAPFRFGVAFNGAGRAAASLNGAAVVAATGGPAAGLTTFRLGANATPGNFMFGETGYLRVLPSTLSDADLVTQVAALPA